MAEGFKLTTNLNNVHGRNLEAAAGAYFHNQCEPYPFEGPPNAPVQAIVGLTKAVAGAEGAGLSVAAINGHFEKAHDDFRINNPGVTMNLLLPVVLDR